MAPGFIFAAGIMLSRRLIILIQGDSMSIALKA
jgi:hypothetical protein